MAKGRERLAFLTDEKDRNETFNNKKRSIMKELNELKIVHGIEACVIVHKLDVPNPEIWSSPRVIVEELAPLAQLKQRKSQESYMKKVIKVSEEMLKKREENKKKEKILCLFEDLKVGDVQKDLSKDELKEYLEFLEEQMNKIEWLMEEAKKFEATQSKSKVVAPPTAKVDDKTTKYKGKEVVVVEGGEGLEMIMDAINEIEIKEMFG